MRRVFGTVLFALAQFSNICWASEDGQVTIVGEGRATAAPEFTRLRVEVTSLCYDSSRAAKDANAVLANQLLDILRGFASDPLDKVVATGGINVLRTETVYVGSEPKVLCQMKWRASNTLILETKSLSLLPDLQDSILASIDASNVNPNAVAQTYAELDQPSFHLRDATLKSLQRKAQLDAYDDAYFQFDVFKSRCNFVDPRLTSIEPPEYAVYARKAGQALTSDTSNTPIIPDDLAVEARWRFVWSYTPGTGCSE